MSNNDNSACFVCLVEKGDDLVSPFHDIPFWVDKEKGIANMVVEIPKGQQAKLEISRDQAFNPIKQDVKVCSISYNSILGYTR